VATASITGNFDRARQRLRRLHDKLARPQGLTADLARVLVDALEANVPVDTGTLASGLTEWKLVGEGHASIGDTNILTDWHIKAPSGTIAAFIRWLREENKRLRKTKAAHKRREVKAKKIRAEKRIAEQRRKAIEKSRARKAALVKKKKVEQRKKEGFKSAREERTARKSFVLSQVSYIMTHPQEFAYEPMGTENIRDHARAFKRYKFKPGEYAKYAAEHVRNIKSGKAYGFREFHKEMMTTIKWYDKIGISPEEFLIRVLQRMGVE